MAGTDPSQDDSDAGGHISTEPRINERIRVPEVRLVGPSGEQVGIVSINDALRLAQEADLDLVEVAPTARPPVCKLMDYGKFKYESALKARESRKNQAQTVIKEIKIRPKIDPHDYGTKKGHVERFLKAGDKVKVTIMFRGREQSRPELGYKLLQRLAGDVEELGFVESQPKQDGRNMIMVIGPHRKKADAKPVRTQTHERASARAAAPSAGGNHAEPAVAESVSAAPAMNFSPSLRSQPSPAQSRPAQPRPAQPRPAAVASSAGGEQASAGGARDGSAAASRSGSNASAPDSRSAAPRPGPSAASAPRPVAPRPTAPRPGPGTAGPRPAAPRPGPSPAGAPRPAAPKPTAPKPGPVGGAPRPTAPKPSAPRATPKPAEPAPVPPPRATGGADGADSGG
ncbi:MAG TPA: translation initiation factor IF-3 [Streptosporangiaceae bacterium]|nr:translation initiation factor IF-3 [Streptosporangiaceae bacterium]